MTKEEAAKYDGPVRVTFNGKEEVCHLIDGMYFLYHPVKQFAKMRGMFCMSEEAEKIEEARVLNIRL